MSLLHGICLLGPPFAEELPQQVGALFATHVRLDGNAVVKAAVFAHGIERADRTGFWVIAPVHQPGHPGIHDRAGTHRAWL